MKISFLSGLEGEIVGCTAPCGASPHRNKAFNRLDFEATTLFLFLLEIVISEAAGIHIYMDICVCEIRVRENLAVHCAKEKK